ncbi:MAG: exodeoxyribonuclease VII large subunit, partial [Coriobacteriales bacterium]|nr:exodeoxyribonuclease VII large subunit [Coriobacteriales bacterium]
MCPHDELAFRAQSDGPQAAIVAQTDDSRIVTRKPDVLPQLDSAVGCVSSSIASRETAASPQPLSVSAALRIAKSQLEDITLTIVGELSDLSDNPRYKAVYFTLRDRDSALPCLIWRSNLARMEYQYGEDAVKFEQDAHYRETTARRDNTGPVPVRSDAYAQGAKSGNSGVGVDYHILDNDVPSSLENAACFLPNGTALSDNRASAHEQTTSTFCAGTLDKGNADYAYLYADSQQPEARRGDRLVARDPAGRADLQKPALRNGMLVEVTGRFSLYAAKGRMQFDVRYLNLAGEGQLRLEVARLSSRLQAEGLMDASRKLSIPTLPTSIALVTSPRGKAVHDVLRTLRRRWPLAQVLLFGTAVEGTGAPPQIILALAAGAPAAAAGRLVVRGGGAVEDVMPMKDEQ